MTIEEACCSIMGDKLANAIIMDQGVHWAVVAAMADARTSHDPEAIATLRAYVREKRNSR